MPVDAVSLVQSMGEGETAELEGKNNKTSSTLCYEI